MSARIASLAATVAQHETVHAQISEEAAARSRAAEQMRLVR
jgi:hypothetical protein